MASTESSRGNCSTKMYTIEASVPTGFESVAADEAREMFGTDCTAVRGKITFPTPAERVKDILKLGGIDHCRAQILRIPCFGFTEDGDDCLSRLQLLVKQCDWAEGLEIWNQFCTFPHAISPHPDTIPTDEQLIDICYSKHMPGHETASQGKKKKNRKFKRKGKKEADGERPEKSNTERGAASDKALEQEGDQNDTTTDHQGENQDLAGCSVTKGAENGTGVKPLTSDNKKDAPSAAVNRVPLDSSTSTEASQGQQDMGSPVKKFKNHSDTGDGGEVCGSAGTEASPQGSTGLATDVAISAHGEGDRAAPCEGGPRSSQDAQNGDTSQNTETNGASADGSPDKQKRQQPADPTKPVFRVTCKRTGENHSFDSMSAAASLGSAIQTYFGWSVSMTNFNIEVMLTIDNHEVTMGLTLTPESLHKRNLVAFGVTTLRPTICHNMLRMVKIRPGHVVCDPLCGTASISIQGALNFPALQLCGDNHAVAMQKTLDNHTAMNAKRRAAAKGALMMDAVRWNAFYLPLRDGVVDVFVSDLPFGKRVGRKFDNQKLYCRVLDEMARCGKLGSRAALLTGDINNMVKAIQAQRYWTRRRCYSCNIGGISAAVFLLFRANLPHAAPTHNHHATPHPSGPRSAQSGSPSADRAEDCSIPSTGKGGEPPVEDKEGGSVEEEEEGCS